MNNKNIYKTSYKQMVCSVGFLFSAFLFAHYAGKLLWT
jgi:hypothetical protein